MYRQKNQTQITKILNEQAETEEFVTIGVSNGVQFEYEHEDLVKIGMIYIRAVKGYESIDYEAVILKYQGEQEGLVQVKNIRHVSEFADLDMQDGKNVREIEITMKSSFLRKGAVAIKISVFKNSKSSSRDTIYLMNTETGLESLSLQKIQCGSKSIFDFKWHPLAELTLQVLLQSQIIEVWDLSHSQNIPDLIELNQMKVSSMITSFANPSDQIFSSQDEIYSDQVFSLFLMERSGEIYRLFPYYPKSLTLPASRIRKESVSNCKLQKSKSKIIVTNSYRSQNLQKLILNFQKSNKKSKSDQMIILPVTEESSIIVCCRHCERIDQSIIKFSLINGSEIFPIREIITSLKGKSKIVKIECARNLIFFFQRNTLFQIDFSLMTSYIKNNDPSFLKSKQAFQVLSIFSLDPEYNVTSLILNSERKQLIIVKREGKKVNFSIHQLVSITNLQEFKQLLHSSHEICDSLKKKLSEVKEDSSNCWNTEKLKIKEQDLKRYQKDGIDAFKKDYESYCLNAKNKIDLSLNKLKEVHELMQGKVKRFLKQSKKKQKLLHLLEEVKKNDQIIINIMKQSNDNEWDMGSSECLEKSQKLIKLFAKFSCEVQRDLQQDGYSEMQKQCTEILERIKIMEDELIAMKQSSS